MCKEKEGVEDYEVELGVGERGGHSREVEQRRTMAKRKKRERGKIKRSKEIGKQRKRKGDRDRER